MKVVTGKPFELSLGEERELSEALAEIQAGKYVDGWDLLAELKRRAAREISAAGR